ncbi:proton channel OTOP2-like [Ambystoma mexicanum]|uniref:proton channel OTOP2-like n=1 Tax=Ambystoma mexicanum TaxID=8296 RepID=UPI0037E8FE3A
MRLYHHLKPLWMVIEKEKFSPYHLDSLYSIGNMTALPARLPTIWKKGGRLFSALVAINILLLGCSLITSASLKGVPIQEAYVLVFLCILMVLAVLWMFFQMYYTHKNHNAILFKDCHAGPIWLRGGLLLFGMCTLLLDCFKIGHFVGYASCLSSIHVIYPVIQIVFVITQIYFLWVSSKHCVQIRLNLTRCGLMLVLTTNLSVWMTAITDESSHLTREMVDLLVQNFTGRRNLTQDRSTDGNGVQYLGVIIIGLPFACSSNFIKASSGLGGDCQCNNVCQLLKRAYYYMYPFNLEFSLFACAMTYVMWKNVGRLMDDHIQRPHHPKLQSLRQIPFVGLCCGVAMITVGLALFVIYEMHIKDEYLHGYVLTIFYMFHVLCLSLMSLGALGGCIVYKFDRRQMDNCKNPSRALDVVLLLAATIGQYCISYFSIVAMVVSHPTDLLRALTLTYSLLLVVQHSMQNIFIIEGLHRQHLEASKDKHRAAPKAAGKQSLKTGCTPEDAPNIRTASLSVPPGQRCSSIQATLSSSLSTHRRRRRLLREIYVFLLLGNILFWIFPAFGARLRFDNHLEVNFYGLSMWVLITNICIPFGIFYRMHAAACLLELCHQP